MSRKIKFRAWFPKDHWCTEKCNGQQMHEDYTGLQVFENFGFFDEEIIYMQFIGMTDKNGKEIYEGDIIELEFQKQVKKYQVYYFMCSFIVRLTPNSTLNIGYLSGSIKVIGNIYENPDKL